MLLDLFSSLDFKWTNFSFLKLWLSSMILFFFFFFFKLSDNKVLSLTQFFFQNGAFIPVQGVYLFLNSVVSSFFFVILMLNLWGLVPYNFGFTSQMVLTMLFSLFLWLMMITSILALSPLTFFAHLTPSSSPLWLGPLLNLMEFVSILIRPFTLSLRLAMNMTTGHIFMTLLNMGLMCLFLKFKLLLVFLVFISVFYLFFEMGVCLMQAFVFGLLMNQYWNEH